MKYFIITLGCQMNYADSERLASYYEARGFSLAKDKKSADLVVINTCMVRQKAEDKIYSMVHDLKKQNNNIKIVVTGCFVGAMEREPSKKMKKYAKIRLPKVDEFLSIDEAGFENLPTREDDKLALLPISNGCNNMCSYCIVPFSRGQEISRPFEDIIKEAESLVRQGYEEVILLGQNVNSYGADLIGCSAPKKGTEHPYTLPAGKIVKPIMVKSMGRTRIPTLFPYLLEEIAKLPFKKVNFISSNPWDFSDELIEVIAKYKNIKREIHLPVQSGDDEILKKMNRHYTQAEYLSLIKKIKDKVSGAEFTTDIIVGFPSETKEQFQNTVALCKQANFNIAFIAYYSPRPGTASEKMKDDVELDEKKRRFAVLDALINKKPHPNPLLSKERE